MVHILCRPAPDEGGRRGHGCPRRTRSGPRVRNFTGEHVDYSPPSPRDNREPCSELGAAHLKQQDRLATRVRLSPELAQRAWRPVCMTGEASRSRRPSTPSSERLSGFLTGAQQRRPAPSRGGGKRRLGCPGRPHSVWCEAAMSCNLGSVSNTSCDKATSCVRIQAELPEEHVWWGLAPVT